MVDHDSASCFKEPWRKPGLLFIRVVFNRVAPIRHFNEKSGNVRLNLYYVRRKKAYEGRRKMLGTDLKKEYYLR